MDMSSNYAIFYKITIIVPAAGKPIERKMINRLT
jgi:hypothetical protein